MEAMPHREELDHTTGAASPAIEPRAGYLPATGAVGSEWRSGLPLLTGDGVTLRELRTSDAPSLFAMLTTAEVSRFISPPPSTVERFERFIACTVRQRLAGEYVCFGIVPKGCDTAVGLIQIRAPHEWETAEWGFAIGSPYWGTGIFLTAAHRVLDFTFTTLGVHRLEARAAVQNGRGNGALRKLGAIEEAVLRRSLPRHNDYLDQILWTILAPEWLSMTAVLSPHIH